MNTRDRIRALITTGNPYLSTSGGLSAEAALDALDILAMALDRIERKLTLPKNMDDEGAIVVWVVVNNQGPIQAYYDKELAEKFRDQLGQGCVNSLALYPS